MLVFKLHTLCTGRWEFALFGVGRLVALGVWYYVIEIMPMDLTHAA